MSTPTRSLSTHVPGNVTACSVALITVAILEGTAQSGWPVPMPSAWALLALMIASRLGGLAGGMWAALLLVAYSVHTSGFTTGHASDAVLWGQSSERILAFGLAAPLVVALTHAGLLMPAGQPQLHDIVRGKIGFGPSEETERNSSKPSSPDIDKAVAALCAVTRRSANDLNNQLTVILGLCELRAAGAVDAWNPEDSPDAIARAVERCHEITFALLDVCGDCRPSRDVEDGPGAGID